MRLKLDENLGDAAAERLRERGHDVATIVEQSLSGSVDEAVAEVARVENRCLVTLDLDFANPMRFVPSRFAGIAVLRLPRPSTKRSLFAVVDTLARQLEQSSPCGRLWIVEEGRVREYEPREQ